MAKHSKEQKAKAVALHKKGMTYEEIKKAMRLPTWQTAWHMVNPPKKAVAKAAKRVKAAAKRSTRRAA